MFKGFEQRLLMELNNLDAINCRKDLVDGYVRLYCNNNNNKSIYKDIIDLLKKYASSSPQIIASPSGQYAAWIGGSILSSISTFKQICITNDQYDEFGPSIIHRQLPIQ